MLVSREDSSASVQYDRSQVSSSRICETIGSLVAGKFTASLVTERETASLVTEREEDFTVVDIAEKVFIVFLNRLTS